MKTKFGWERGASREAFTLVELLVVMIIIAIVIGIVLPALGAARDVARKTASSELMNQFTASAASFQNEKRRLPGYFSARDMADQSANEGMSAMENALLDLAGEGVIYGLNDADPGGLRVTVGPIAGNRQVKVDPDMLMTNTKGYFTAPAKYMVAQLAGTQQMGNAGHTGAEGARQLPDFVDAWGSPFLLWVQDEISQTPVTRMSEFACAEYSNNSAARFYWKSNKCFLTATSLGRKGINQTDNEKGSLIADVQNSDNDAGLNAMCAMLGSPSAIKSEDTQAAMRNIRPTAGRGKLVMHSAGTNATYLGRKETGARQAGGALFYGLNFKDASNQFNTDANGQPATVDVMGAFDDLFVSGGN